GAQASRLHAAERTAVRCKRDACAESDTVSKHSGHPCEFLQIENVRHENRSRVKSARSAAMAGAFRARLHQFTQVSGDRLNSAGSDLRANRFVVSGDLRANFWVVEIEFGGRVQDRVLFF